MKLETNCKYSEGDLSCMHEVGISLYCPGDSNQEMGMCLLVDTGQS